jgi:NADPH:quinone reductase-like Zn-dependent oxidoreductase
MRAAAIDKFGPPSVLELHELPIPRPSPREVLIAVEWAGVGSWDAAIREGSWAEGKKKFPLVLGVDGSGTVVAKGSRVRRLRVGDRVWAYQFENPKGGFYAKYVVARDDHVDRVPRRLTMRDAGTIPCTGLTALVGVQTLRLRRGSVVLIFGASGAVGTLAVQMAKQRGAIVAATASGASAQHFLRQLGAKYVVDARKKSSVEQLREELPRPLESILAFAGGPDLERFIDLLGPKGRLAYPNGVEPEPKKRKGLTIKTFDGISDPRHFAELGKFAERGLKAVVAAEFPLSQSAAAHRRLEKGHVLGRIVLRV